MTTLQTFWIRFEKIQRPTALNLGCGITAYGVEDATDLLNKRVLQRNPGLVVIDIKEGISFDHLEKGHVRPNIGKMDSRGVWFPQGY